MDRYGVYIWISYALAAIILAVNALLPLWQRRTLLQRLRAFYQSRRSDDETKT